MALTSSQYQEIMRGYELTRDNNRKTLEARREQVYEQLPEYRELDAAVATYAKSRIRLLLESPEEAQTEEKNPIPEITARKKALLVNAGFSKDYLDPIFDCKSCKDTGYVLLENGLREKCRCFRKKELRYLYEQSNLQGVLETDHFDNLSYEYCQGDDLEHLKGAVRISKEFAEHFPNGG